MNKSLIGLKISEMRKTKRLSQEELAAKSGVARRAIQRLENGEGSSTISTLEAIAKALGTSLIVHFGDSEEEKLLGLFREAVPRNRSLILGYARGLLDGHQTEPRTRETSD